MGTFQHVLHTGARPIGIPEFMDAMRVTCKPRFPYARGILHRRVALAVSGGVDSMALAFLCSQIRKHDPDFKISDNPVSSFRGLVVDHKLREGSEKEGLAVCDALLNLGLTAELLTLNWSDVLGDYNHPKDLPNFESVARTLRYQKLGSACLLHSTVSLLMAHHEDDQFETVLMRLLSGHGSRGLRGMRKVNDIPECNGIFGVDRSGFVDDQMRKAPYYNLKPSRKQRKQLHRDLRSSIGSYVDEADMNESDPDLPYIDVEEFYQPERVISDGSSTVEVEDGGITLYRPMLEFSKDRLIATCLENNIPWWEDATNTDPTLTMRNAVRHLYKGYTLPKALQKPAILALSKRCERRVQAQEDEANRLLSRTIIHKFEPRAGTLRVQFPELAHNLSPRDSHSPLRQKARLQRQREAAAILIRRLLMTISPEPQPPILAVLENHVPRIFPTLAHPNETTLAAQPRAFNISGVYFVPIKSNPQPTTWHLSRAPYESKLPLPRVRTQHWDPDPHRTKGQKLSPRMPWELWDGRYWVHIRHRFPCRVVVQPFLPSHVAEFRERLPFRDHQRLVAALKRFAPAKVRYTLPAIYLEDPPPLTRGGPRGSLRPDYCDMMVLHRKKKAAIGMLESGGGEDVEKEGEDSMSSSRYANGQDPNSPSRMVLIALPTLDAKIPHLDKWMSYGIRYKKVDRGTLGVAGTFHRGSFVAPRLSRGARRRARGNSNNSNGKQGCRRG